MGFWIGYLSHWLKEKSSIHNLLLIAFCMRKCGKSQIVHEKKPVPFLWAGGFHLLSLATLILDGLNFLSPTNVRAVIRGCLYIWAFWVVFRLYLAKWNLSSFLSSLKNPLCSLPPPKAFLLSPWSRLQNYFQSETSVACSTLWGVILLPFIGGWLHPAFQTVCLVIRWIEKWPTIWMC